MERYPKGLGPDGLAFDAEGNLYVAVFGTGTIKVISPAGVMLHRILLPGSNPTNCAFDPAGELGLVVTEAETGQLLSIAVEAKGAPLYNRTRICDWTD